MEKMNMFRFRLGTRFDEGPATYSTSSTSTQIRIFSLGLTVALLLSASGPAAETWTWTGATADVAAASNWSLSSPSSQAGPPGVTTGTQFDRIASFGATGSTTLTQT